jgi:hypothetical protein
MRHFFGRPCGYPKSTIVGQCRASNPTAINSTKCFSPTMSVTVDLKNRVTSGGFTYDDSKVAQSLAAPRLCGLRSDAPSRVGGQLHTVDGEDRMVGANFAQRAGEFARARPGPVLRPRH